MDYVIVESYLESFLIRFNDEVSEYFVKIKRERNARLSRIYENRSDVELESSPLIKRRHFYALLGLIELPSSPYLIFASKSSKIGCILGKDIFQVDNFEVLPLLFDDDANTLKDSENEFYFDLLKSFLSIPGFYYSFQFDLSLNLQQHQESTSTNRASFVWNDFIANSFLDSDPKFTNFIPRLILGSVSIEDNCVVDSHSFKLILISRKSSEQAGLRFFTRGADQDGNVANFVETEQIIEFADSTNDIGDDKMVKCSSFVQSRGSIPLLWTQYPNLKYKPDLRISLNDGEQRDVMRKHFEQQTKMYPGKQVVINLLDRKKFEAPLVQAFERFIFALENEGGNNNVSYIHFDFHEKCRKLQWHNLSLLIDTVSEKLNDMKFFSADITLPKFSFLVKDKQCGIFRTNCLDCLDRTNVVQSLFAFKVLTKQLVSFGILNFKDFNYLKQKFPAFYSTFSQVWADNADSLSVQYAGTPALKTDFTRTGKRTKMGLLLDGANSLQRYIKNNFQQGDLQDSFDLFLGLHDLSTDLPSSSPRRKGFTLNVHLIAPLLAIFSIGVFFLNILLPSQHENFFDFIKKTLFSLSIFSLSILYIFKNGRNYVNTPNLLRSKYAIDALQ